MYNMMQWRRRAKGRLIDMLISSYILYYYNHILTNIPLTYYHITSPSYIDKNRYIPPQQICHKINKAHRH